MICPRTEPSLLIFYRYILHQTSGPFLKESDAHLTVSFACASYLSTSHCLIDSRYSEEEQVLRVAKGFHGLHLYAHEFMLKHILRYAELQSFSKLEFSEALATRLEKLLQFEKPNISASINAALYDHTSLPKTVQLLSILNLPLKLQTFVQNLLTFQDMSAQDNNHHREPQGSCTQSKALPRSFFFERKYLLVQRFVGEKLSTIQRFSTKYCINIIVSPNS